MNFDGAFVIGKSDHDGPGVALNLTEISLSTCDCANLMKS